MKQMLEKQLQIVNLIDAIDTSKIKDSDMEYIIKELDNIKLLLSKYRVGNK